MNEEEQFYEVKYEVSKNELSSESLQSNISNCEYIVQTTNENNYVSRLA